MTDRLTDSDIDCLVMFNTISSDDGEFLRRLKDARLAMLHYRKGESLSAKENDAIDDEIAVYVNAEPSVSIWRPVFTVVTTSLPGARKNSDRSYEVRRELQGGGYRVVAEFSGSNDSKAQAKREAARRNKMEVNA